MPARPYPVGSDGAYFEGPLLYKGANMLASSGGAAEVTIFDGPSAAFEYLDNLRAAASEHDIHLMDGGVYVLRGLFVDIGANVRFCTLYLDFDIPEAVGGPRQGP